MELSIIIVNWNSREYLKKCIGSIYAAIRGMEFEIIVIDSASFDGCREMLQKFYPMVRFIQSQKNIGFAKANNIAFQKSLGQHVLFLNPDTEVVGPAIKIMFGFLMQLPKAGAIGCRLLNADNTVQTSCLLPFPTILNQLLDSELLRSVCPKSSLWGNAPLFSINDGPVEVEAISGACLMMKREVFEQVGLFSEEYFMYSEDIDLCYKFAEKGYKNYYIQDATVIHFGGGSTLNKSNDFTTIIMHESRFLFFRKTKGETYSYIYRASTLIAAAARMIALILFLPWLIFRWGIDSWKSSFAKWRAIMKWSLGFVGDTIKKTLHAEAQLN